MPAERIPVGIWWELPPGARWTNEGVSRVVGFLIEGAASNKKYCFHIVVRRGMGGEVRADLQSLAAVEGEDWRVHEPSREQEQKFNRRAAASSVPYASTENIALALFANAHVPVDGWVVTFPHFTGSMWLEQSKGVLMPDAIPFDFPLGWVEQWNAEGFWPRWREQARRVCEAADAIINFSEHVAIRHSGPLLGIDREKIHVVPLAPPDLAGELPFVRARKRTPASRAQAAAILREHAALRGLDYLRNFPFEQCTFIVGATQDRPTKNLGLVADATERMIRQDREDLKLFLTAPLHYGAPWTRLPKVVEGRLFHRDLQSLHDLPREVHAAMFHAASLTVHASFYEGIIGCLPLYESISIGTPCLFARGPHSAELLEAEPDFLPFTFDPSDREGLAALIRRTLREREDALAIQQQIYARLHKRTWADVADGYVKAALAGRRRLAA
jgi:glycosyltransferase involved in cell wall biosynthesis